MIFGFNERFCDPAAALTVKDTQIEMGVRVTTLYCESVVLGCLDLASHHS
jgi:hypothetical protein